MWEKIKGFFSLSKEQEWDKLTEKQKELFFQARKEFQRYSKVGMRVYSNKTQPK